MAFAVCRKYLVFVAFVRTNDIGHRIVQIFAALRRLAIGHRMGRCMLVVRAYRR